MRHNQVQAPRFEADGRVPLPNATKTGLAQAVKEALHQVETGQAPGAEASGQTGGVAGTAAYWAQQALSVLSLGKGPASVPSDALEMFYEAGGLKAGGQSSQGSATAETKSIVLGHLEGLVHAEKAKATIHLATQAALPDGARVNTEGALQQLTDAAKAAEQRSKDAATAASARMVAELLSGVPEPLQARLQAATDTLVAALNHGTKVPDVLAVELLVNTARDTFAGDPEGLATAMEDLSHSPPARLVGLVHDALQSSGQDNETRAEQAPLSRLACAIAGPSGGMRMLARMTDPPAAGTRQDALQVAMSAMLHLQSTLQQDGPGAAEAPADLDLMRAAVEHAVELAQPRHHPVPESERTVAQRTAFNCLQNGFATKAQGSSYDRVRQRLLQFSDGALDQTSQRNARAASGRLGRLRNWLTGGLPKAIVKNSAGMEGLLAPALPAIASWLPGAQPTMWRESVMRKMTAAAGENGMLPRRAAPRRGRGIAAPHGHRPAHRSAVARRGWRVAGRNPDARGADGAGAGRRHAGPLAEHAQAPGQGPVPESGSPPGGRGHGRAAPRPGRGLASAARQPPQCRAHPAGAERAHRSAGPGRWHAVAHGGPHPGRPGPAHRCHRPRSHRRLP
ncbi:hypothetical protein AVAK2825_15915 [Acidovorax sp. SUPP2825]|nr:hypothetical protein AVAK2825_15915 [Acidovorax sp. SUPP2825]